MPAACLPVATVLVVDDEPSICMLAAEMLSEYPLRVLTALDGFQALRLLEEEQGHVDLAILDYSMPGMDCEALIEQLRKVNGEILLVISSGAPVKLRDHPDSCEIDGLIPKPYSMRQLAELVLSLIGNSPNEKNV